MNSGPEPNNEAMAESFEPAYKRIICTIERCAGNSEIGSMWTETKSFAKNTPVSQIMEWASKADGKVMLSIDQSRYDDVEFS